MKLLGAVLLVIPDDSDERTTPGGIIIPPSAKRANSNLKAGVIAAKGTGTPWNDMSDVHVKHRVMWRNGAGQPYTQDNDGVRADYLIIPYEELYLV